MKKAFTFLEVMFGLAIVGLISAMVIPVFYNSYANRIMGTELKKVTAQVATAAREIISDEHADEVIEFETVETTEEGTAQSATTETTETEGTDNNTKTYDHGFYLTSAASSTSNSKQGVEYFLKKYFKHSKTNCGLGGSGDCVGAQYRSPKKTILGTVPNDFYCIKTINAATICMKKDDDTGNILVIIDVNGHDRPNIPGADTFVMYITNDGDLMDLDDEESNCNKERTDIKTIISYASGCYTKIIANGWKMPNK